MLKLLNRFAWLISIAFWCFFFAIEDDLFLLWVLVTFLIKYFLLSKKYIESRLEFFVKSAFSRQKQTDVYQSSKVETIIKDENIEKVEIEKEDSLLTNSSNLEENKKIENDVIITGLDNDLKNEKQENVLVDTWKEIIEKTEKVKEIIAESEWQKAIKEFFMKDILAKIGAILVFLGVFFLMVLVWNIIPDTIKLLIGFSIWFGFYFSGSLLDKKWYNSISRILFWTWILINYLVILSWEYLLWDNFISWWEWLYPSIITFFLLILNTIFLVITSFVYNSRILLIFWIIFAYLNPFLLWDKFLNDTILIWYSLIISLWALFIWYKQKDNVLTFSSFVLWNILFLIAPIENEAWWVIKFILSGILALSAIYSLYLNNFKKNITPVLIINYIFISLLLIQGSLVWIMWEAITYILYSLSIFWFLWIAVYLISSQFIISATSILFLLAFPIFIFIELIFTGVLVTTLIYPTLLLVLLIYLLWFKSLYWVISISLKYLYFVLLWAFIFLVSFYIDSEVIYISPENFITVLISIFIFLFSTYYLSKKEWLVNLYLVWTIWTIFILTPILLNDFSNVAENKNLIPSVVAIVLFGVSSQLLPFFNKNLIEKTSSIKTLVITNIASILFIWYQLYIYWNQFFPWIILGLAFWALAILYFFLWFINFNKFWIEKVKTEMNFKNSIFMYLFISISLFSFAIMLIFSGKAEIISTIWLLEASVLFYFYNKTKEVKIFIVWIVLFLIWVFQSFNLMTSINTLNYYFIIPVSIIFISFALNLKNLDFSKSLGIRIPHDLLQSKSVLFFLGLLIMVFNFEQTEVLIFWSLSLLIFWFLYSYYNSIILKYFYFICFWIFLLSHVGLFDYCMTYFAQDNIWISRFIHYFITIILWICVFVWGKFNKVKLINNLLVWSYLFYLIVIISIYILNIFETTFAVTIFWWLVSSIFLLKGIGIDKIKLRTIGLYILLWVLIKIFSYDLWFGLEDWVSRILALIWIGVLLIFISIQYTKKYWNNLKWEFDLDNLNEKK